MVGVKVTWRVWINIPETYWDQFEADIKDYTDYEGVVLSYHRGWFDTYLIVACTDGKIREVTIDKVNILSINNETIHT